MWLYRFWVCWTILDVVSRILRRRRSLFLLWLGFFSYTMTTQMIDVFLLSFYLLATYQPFASPLYMQLFLLSYVDKELWFWFVEKCQLTSHLCLLLFNWWCSKVTRSEAICFYLYISLCFKNEIFTWDWLRWSIDLLRCFLMFPFSPSLTVSMSL